ncbi:2-aminoethylphosphonate aminotransferase [Sinorhizobium kostiense]|uniref:2-aminoethylphosphonate--pyruvate transaminase n=1 Tax=Sinorhizobium kostiense TaxID=76747 RepID=A0ABS4QZW3_9HYPH|nr:2-aminoethylphosphonate--pyruvate transaminase [Sinorhizobium kostiense]MBP2236182.1 2-aminoethylphosphonate aminotransferase [Sinorhizobium kostiense]
MQETCLFTPGPLSLSSDVKDAMRVDLGSRDETFKQVTQRVRDRLLHISGTDKSHSAVLMQGSGTFALEAALATFLGATDKALVCINGLYGERIARILEKSGKNFETLLCSAALPIDVAAVERIICRDKQFTHLCFVHCETTTGLINPVKSLLEIGRRNGLVTVVDAMSSFGGLRLDDDIDILVSSGNKCIEAPAGVAFAIVSNRLLASGKSSARSFCFDMMDQWQHFEQHREWRTTPPTHIVQAFDKALERLIEEGIPARNARYSRVQEKLLRGMRALGFKTIIPQEHQSPICLAFCSIELVPDEAAFAAYYGALAQQGIYIYAKFHEPTTTFRIGCIGQIQDFWIDKLLAVTAAHFRISPSILAA